MSCFQFSIALRESFFFSYNKTFRQSIRFKDIRQFPFQGLWKTSLKGSPTGSILVWLVIIFVITHVIIVFICLVCIWMSNFDFINMDCIRRSCLVISHQSSIFLFPWFTNCMSETIHTNIIIRIPIRIFFSKQESVAPLHTLSKLDVPVGFVNPLHFRRWIALFAVDKRLAVARYRIFHLVHQWGDCCYSNRPS